MQEARTPDYEARNPKGGGEGVPGAQQMTPSPAGVAGSWMLPHLWSRRSSGPDGI